MFDETLTLPKIDIKFMLSFFNRRKNIFRPVPAHHLIQSRNYIKYIFNLSAFTTAIYFSMPAHAETLIEVYKQAQENDHTYRAARATYEAGLENKTIGRSALLPQITGEISITDSDTDQTGESFLINDESAGGGQSSTLEINNEQRRYGITLSQPLFNLSTWYEYKN